MNNICSEGTNNQSVTFQYGRLWEGMSMRDVPIAAENFCSGSWIGLYEVKEWYCCNIEPIWSMMGIIIALLIRKISYRYWMRLSRISYGCATKTLYETILCSQYLWAKILILQRTWGSYQVKTWNNTSRLWIAKLKVLWEGTHERFFQGIQLLIKM